MKLKLLRQHVINDVLYEPETILGDGGVDIPANYTFTPYMLGLDDEGIEAVRQANIRAFGRYIPFTHTLIDDPPIPRPLDENQPVPHVPAPRGGGFRR